VITCVRKIVKAEVERAEKEQQKNKEGGN